MVIHTAVLWGWRDRYKTYSERQRIARAACQQVGFDFGYPKALAVSMLPCWFGKLHESIIDGDRRDPLSPSHCGSVGYLETIRKHHPEYLHELFRYAQGVIGILATFSEYVEMMNSKSAVPGEMRPTLSLNRRQVAKWFKQNGGKERSCIKKPLLTDKHKNARKVWVHKNFHLLNNPTSPVTFLDEKWFYTTSRRKQIKQLPKSLAENQEPKYVAPKIRSCQFPVKVMYLGVVAAPQDEHEFSGRVFLKRVSKCEVQKRASRNQRFSVDVLINESLKNGSWRNLVVEDQQVGDVLDEIVSNFDLDEFVSDRLELVYTTHTRGGVKQIKNLRKEQVIGEIGMRTNKEGEQQEITIEDLQLYVHINQGDEVEKDCSCDSSFMLETIPEVGKALREKFHWVPEQEKIFLVMDNAGGHGTNDAIATYTEGLQIYNVEIIWQVPRSPETNMLDLGVWMSVQSAVGKNHRRQRCAHDALAKSIVDSWNNYLSTMAFHNVFKQLCIIMRFILEKNGGNQLVEQKCGKLFRNANITDFTTFDNN